MSGNIEVSIKVEFKATNALPTPLEEQPTQMGNGQFQLVMDGGKSLDIDALEQGMLRTNFPALRNALSTYLEQELKKIGRGASNASRA